MQTILSVIPSLGYTGTAKQLVLLATALPRDRFRFHTCVLGRDGPLAQTLRAQGLQVTVLGWHRLFDLSALSRLRQLAHSLRPDVLHFWQRTALRLLDLADGRGGSRVLVSSPCEPGASEGKPRRLDLWLLGRADRIIARGPAEAEHCRRWALTAEKIVVVPPGVELADGNVAHGEFPSALGKEFAETTRYVLGFGPFERHKGFQDALWAMGVLKYLDPDLHLVLVGEGPEREHLEVFARTTQVADRVHFLGLQAETANLLARSLAVWVPSRSAAGRQTALEAMAAGRPVVASRLPELAEIVVDGESGLLFPAGDKVALARQTRLLLEDASLREQLGAAGRRRVADHFQAGAMVRHYQRLYEE